MFLPISLPHPKIAFDNQQLAAPRQVYRNFAYRKQTKLQFARDDPAFLVLLAGWLVVSSAFFSYELGIGLWGYVKFLLYVIFVDCIGCG